MSNVGGFSYNTTGLVVPPLTWTTLPSPTQYNTSPGYTVSGNTVSSIYSPNTIQMVLLINVNNTDFPSLASVGASQAAFRIVNGGALRGRYLIDVFDDPSQTYQENVALRTDWFAYSMNINNFELQVYHNGSSDYTGPISASLNFVPEH